MRNDAINAHSKARLEEIYASLAEVQQCLDLTKYVVATYDDDNRMDKSLWTVPGEDEVIADFRKAVDSVNDFIGAVRRRESELLSRDWRN